MFYCKECAQEYEYPTNFYLPRSRGPCELCKKGAICFDVPSSTLLRRAEAADMGAADGLGADPVDTAEGQGRR